MFVFFCSWRGPACAVAILSNLSHNGMDNGVGIPLNEPGYASSVKPLLPDAIFSSISCTFTMIQRIQFTFRGVEPSWNTKSVPSKQFTHLSEEREVETVRFAFFLIWLLLKLVIPHQVTWRRCHRATSFIANHFSLPALPSLLTPSNSRERARGAKEQQGASESARPSVTLSGLFADEWQ